jgi:hypothetical protein
LGIKRAREQELITEFYQVRSTCGTVLQHSSVLSIVPGYVYAKGLEAWVPRGLLPTMRRIVDGLEEKQMEELRCLFSAQAYPNKVI